MADPVSYERRGSAAVLTIQREERRFGVPLIDGGTQRLPRIVGLGRALDMILSGRIVEAEEAERIGLVTEIVAPGRHLERALEMAEALARFPQETMLADRSAALEGIGLTLEEGLRLEARAALPTLEAAVPCAASRSRSSAARCSACSAPTGRARRPPSRSSRATGAARPATSGCSGRTPRAATGASRSGWGSCSRAAASTRAR